MNAAVRVTSAMLPASTQQTPLLQSLATATASGRQTCRCSTSATPRASAPTELGPPASPPRAAAQVIRPRHHWRLSASPAISQPGRASQPRPPQRRRQGGARPIGGERMASRAPNARVAIGRPARRNRRCRWSPTATGRWRRRASQPGHGFHRQAACRRWKNQHRRGEQRCQRIEAERHSAGPAAARPRRPAPGVPPRWPACRPASTGAMACAVSSATTATGPTGVDARGAEQRIGCHRQQVGVHAHLAAAGRASSA